MRYVILVSHGMFANGMHDAVKMLSGNESDEIRSIGLLRDMGADEFAVEFRKILPEMGPDDDLILFADIVGGSPLSTAANVIAEEGLLGKTLMIGGMNLPLVLTGVLSKDVSVAAEADADDDI